MLYDQGISERKSIWDITDLNSNLSDPLRNQQIVPLESMASMSELVPVTSVSYISPQYGFNNSSMQQYQQAKQNAWTTDAVHSNSYVTVKKSACTPNRKCILTVLTMGIIIGLFVCGVPLAVMTTLYLQEKAQTSSSTVASTGTSSSSVSLPSQCTSYTSIADGTRTASCSGTTYSDCSLTTGWYRFTGGSGTRLVTNPLSMGYCCTSYPSWFNGSLPSTVGSVTSGTACANVNGNLCHSSYSVNSILATNCDGFYVFYLMPMPICNSRYCTV